MSIPYELWSCEFLYLAYVTLTGIIQLFCWSMYDGGPKGWSGTRDDIEMWVKHGVGWHTVVHSTVTKINHAFFFSQPKYLQIDSVHAHS